MRLARLADERAYLVAAATQAPRDRKALDHVGWIGGRNQLGSGPFKSFEIERLNAVRFRLTPAVPISCARPWCSGTGRNCRWVPGPDRDCGVFSPASVESSFSVSNLAGRSALILISTLAAKSLERHVVGRFARKISWRGTRRSCIRDRRAPME